MCSDVVRQIKCVHAVHTDEKHVLDVTAVFVVAGEREGTDGKGEYHQ